MQTTARRVLAPTQPAATVSAVKEASTRMVGAFLFGRVSARGHFLKPLHYIWLVIFINQVERFEWRVTPTLQQAFQHAHL